MYLVVSPGTRLHRIVYGMRNNFFFLFLASEEYATEVCTEFIAVAISLLRGVRGQSHIQTKSGHITRHGGSRGRMRHDSSDHSSIPK
jgi:hypothetical protein